MKNILALTTAIIMIGLNLSGAYATLTQSEVAMEDTIYVMAQENFDQQDFSLVSNVGTGQIITDRMSDFSITRGSFDKIEVQPSPNNNDGSVKGGKSLKYTRTAVVGESGLSTSNLTYQGEGIESLISGRGGANLKLAFEISIMAGQTNVTANLLNLRHSTTGAAVEFLKLTSNGYISYNNSNLVEYEANKWYKMRFEFNMKTKQAICYLDTGDGNGYQSLVVDDSMAIPDEFYTNGIRSFNTILSNTSGRSGTFWLDDIKLEHHVPPPFGKIFVDPTGNDGAYTTIQAAMDAAVDLGTTVVVKDGVYEEDIVISNRGSKHGRITLESESGNAVIRGGSIIIDANAPYITIKGLKMDGLIKHHPTNPESTPMNAITINAPFCEVLNMDIRNYVGFTIMCPPNTGTNARLAYNYVENCLGGFQVTSNTIVENNEIFSINNHESLIAAADVFRVFGNDIIFRNNYSHGTLRENLKRGEPWNDYVHSDVFQSWDDIRVETYNVLIENNVFQGFYHQGLMLENDKFGLSEDKFYIHSWTLRNNIFSGFAAWAVCGGKVNGGIPNMVIENNLFVTDSAHYGVGMVGLNSSAYLRNNIFVGCTLTAEHGAVVDTDHNLFYNGNLPAANAAGAHDLVAIDPLFVKYTADNAMDDNPETMNDYRLRSDSPAIDRGADTRSVFNTDHDGNPRKYGNNVDMGPFEFQGAPTYVDLPPEVTQKTPSFTAKYQDEVLLTAEATDDAFVKRVDFFVNGKLIGYKEKPDVHGGNLYSVKWRANLIGTNVVTVKAYDAAGQNATSNAINIAVNRYIKQRINIETFDDDFYIDTENSAAADNVKINDQYQISRQSFDVIQTAAAPKNNDGTDRVGKSLYFYREPKAADEPNPSNASQLTYIGPGIGTSSPANIAPSSKFSLKMNVFMRQTNMTFRPFSLRNTGSGGGTYHLLSFQRTGSICFNDSSLGIQSVPDKWYTVQMEVDFESNIITVFLDNQPIMMNVPFAPEVDFSTRGADYIDTMLHFARGQGGEYYIDDIELSLYEVDNTPILATASITKLGTDVEGVIDFAIVDSPYTAQIFVAYYEENKLIDIAYYEREISQNGQVEMVTMEVPENISDIRLFAWDGDMVPIVRTRL